MVGMSMSASTNVSNILLPSKLQASILKQPLDLSSHPFAVAILTDDGSNSACVLGNSLSVGTRPRGSQDHQCPNCFIVIVRMQVEIRESDLAFANLLCDASHVVLVKRLRRHAFLVLSLRDLGSNLDLRGNL